MKIYGHLLEESLFFWDDFLAVGSAGQVDEAAYQILVDHFGEGAMTFKREGSGVEYTRDEWKRVFGWDELERVVKTLSEDHIQ